MPAPSETEILIFDCVFVTFHIYNKSKQDTAPTTTFVEVLQRAHFFRNFQVNRVRFDPSLHCKHIEKKTLTQTIA